MSLADLWEIPEADESIKTPTATLKEIAYYLSGKTDRVLSAHVRRSSVPSLEKVRITLHVVAPALHNYSVEVLRVEHRLFEAYPSVVQSSINDMRHIVDSESELLQVVENIIQSEEMIKILRALLIESQSGVS